MNPEDFTGDISHLSEEDQETIRAQIKQAMDSNRVFTDEDQGPSPN
jgi:hypothetical protein